MSSSESDVPSGLTLDGVRIPLAIEAEGAAAIELYLAEHTGAAPAVPDSPANPPTHAEGAES